VLEIRKIMGKKLMREVTLKQRTRCPVGPGKQSVTFFVASTEVGLVIHQGRLRPCSNN